MELAPVKDEAFAEDASSMIPESEFQPLSDVGESDSCVSKGHWVTGREES